MAARTIPTAGGPAGASATTNDNPTRDHEAATALPQGRCPACDCTWQPIVLLDEDGAERRLVCRRCGWE